MPGLRNREIDLPSLPRDSSFAERDLKPAGRSDHDRLLRPRDRGAVPAFSARPDVFQFTPNNRHSRTGAVGPVGAKTGSQRTLLAAGFQLVGHDVCPLYRTQAERRGRV